MRVRVEEEAIYMVVVEHQIMIDVRLEVRGGARNHRLTQLASVQSDRFNLVLVGSQQRLDARRVPSAFQKGPVRRSWKLEALDLRTSRYGTQDSLQDAEG
jgi:hypothetical protein